MKEYYPLDRVYVCETLRRNALKFQRKIRSIGETISVHVHLISNKMISVKKWLTPVKQFVIHSNIRHKFCDTCVR